MVGAGMSRNAESLRPGRPVMPTWSELTNALIDRLYPKGSDGDRRRDWLRRTSDAVSVATRLAEEYAAAFGRHELDGIIRESIPDDDFGPGLLHHLLLELPWADVLTTNYDTLLERAAVSVFGRQYTVVRRPQEIASAARPRIVKLHGSFPSNGPFILTEDDFRTYPRRYSPFVNLARQAVMENILCLIGFSGDDPNFLAWSGWVRDELAEYAPRIYLCGLLGLSTSERAVLQGRGVIPIDLSPVFPPSDYPDPAVRHRLALEWLFRTLQAGRPYDPMDWPIPPPARPVCTANLPSLLASDGATPCDEPFGPPEAGELLDRAVIWAKNRKVYPGWLIAPEEVRDRVWFHTNSWIPRYVTGRVNLQPIDDLRVLFELNWRLQTVLSPIWNNLRPAYEAVLSAVNPFPGELTDLPSTAITPSVVIDPLPDWKELQRQWLSIAFALLRFYREERLHDQFEVWYRRIGRLTSLNHDNRARWSYERCLLAVQRGIGKRVGKTAIMADRVPPGL
jgi:hypothetical protein